MRLEPAEVRALPLPACLIDLRGQEVVATPEWAGPSPGTLSYHTGQGHLLVASEEAPSGPDRLAARLLSALQEAAAVMDGEGARRVAVLAAGLELTSGRPPGGLGSARTALELAAAAIRARTQDLRLTVAEPLPDQSVPAPAAVALALVQLAVNAQQHEQASQIELRVSAGPTFHVEWPSPAGRPASPPSHRHFLRRRRWGWGYVQMVADCLGGSALPAAPVAGGRRGASLGLGAARLTLPLACIRGGWVERSTLAWDQDPDVAGFGQAVDGTLADLVRRAEARPGRIAFHDLYRARTQADRTWVVLCPESGSARTRDLLRGLGHERALWSAPEPHATRVQALSILLGAALGEPLPSVPPSLWAEALPQACAALGLSPPPTPDALLLPDPRLAAFLLAETGGRLVCAGDEVCLEAAHDRILDALPRGPGGLVSLCR